MYLPVSIFPDPPKYLVDPVDPDLCHNPVNEDHDRKVSNDEIVAQDDVQVQTMRHKSSFFRGDNSWNDFHKLTQIVIYIEGADLNEKPEGLSIIL